MLHHSLLVFLTDRSSIYDVNWETAFEISTDQSNSG